MAIGNLRFLDFNPKRMFAVGVPDWRWPVRVRHGHTANSDDAAGHCEAQPIREPRQVNFAGSGRAGQSNPVDLGELEQQRPIEALVR